MLFSVVCFIISNNTICSHVTLRHPIMDTFINALIRVTWRSIRTDLRSKFFKKDVKSLCSDIHTVINVKVGSIEQRIS